MERDMPTDLDSTEQHASDRRHDFGSYGLENLAYIRPVVVDGQLLHEIHAADGTPLSMLASRELAVVTIRQNDLEPVSLH